MKTHQFSLQGNVYHLGYAQDQDHEALSRYLKEKAFGLSVSFELQPDMKTVTIEGECQCVCNQASLFDCKCYAEAFLLYGCLIGARYIRDNLRELKENGRLPALVSSENAKGTGFNFSFVYNGPGRFRHFGANSYRRERRSCV